MLPPYVCLHVTAMCRPVFRTNPAWHVFDIVLASMSMIMCDKDALQDMISCMIHNMWGFWPYIGMATNNVWLYGWQSLRPSNPSLLEKFSRSTQTASCWPVLCITLKVESLKLKPKLLGPKWSTACYFANILISATPPQPNSPPISKYRHNLFEY